MDDSLPLIGRNQPGDQGNVGSGHTLQSVKFEAFFAIEGVEDLCRCTNSVLGDDAAAGGRPGASMANSVLDDERRQSSSVDDEGRRDDSARRRREMY